MAQAWGRGAVTGMLLGAALPEAPCCPIRWELGP